MRRAAWTGCLILLMAESMLLLPATKCEAQPVDVQIHLNLNANPAQIWIQDTGKFVGLCREGTSGPERHCTGNQISWRLLVTPAAGWDSATDRVYIKNAPDHPSCFGLDPVATFTGHNQEQSSGIPAVSCTDDKYGTYWPYVVEFRREEQLMATTDPGGIIFP